MTDYNKLLRDYTYRYENEEFLFWFKEVYGKYQTECLKKLAKASGESPYNCVNPETKVRYWHSEHNGGAWLPVKRKFRGSWKKD